MMSFVTCLLLIPPLLFAQRVIPVEVGQNGHIVVKASINAVEGTFIFDTGAGLHVVSKRFFQRIKEQVQDSSHFTVFRHTGERLDGPMYLFDNISLGPIQQTNAWVGIYAGFDEQGFDGLVSCKLIENQPLTFDVSNKQLIVESPGSLRSRRRDSVPVLLHTDRNHSLDFFIRVKIDQQYDALLEFDTGAGYSPVLLHSRYMKYAALDTSRMEVRNSSTGFGESETAYLDKTKKLHVFLPEIGDGGYPDIIFKPSLIYDGLTSHVIFGDKVWTIDIPNKRILVSR